MKPYKEAQNNTKQSSTNAFAPVDDLGFSNTDYDRSRFDDQGFERNASHAFAPTDAFGFVLTGDPQATPDIGSNAASSSLQPSLQPLARASVQGAMADALPQAAAFAGGPFIAGVGILPWLPLGGVPPLTGDPSIGFSPDISLFGE